MIDETNNSITTTIYCFNDLSRFTARKRKNLNKERCSIAQQNIKVRRILGKEIIQKDLEFLPYLPTDLFKTPAFAALNP